MAVAVMTDAKIQENVLAELAWDPEVGDTEEIGVEVDDGVVALTGTVDSYAKKLAAERAALRVDGVRAVANDLTVKLVVPTRGDRSDTAIAKAVADALDANAVVPKGRIKVAVEHGWVTLEGEVDWQFEREQAEDTARKVPGVVGVTNLIEVKSNRNDLREEEIKGGIERALLRSAEVDAEQIRVKVEGGHVTLTGIVRTWAEREEAEGAAWRAPGVTKVTNLIEVRPH
jgi:osmotically-inducible protein OsmY